MSVSATSTSMTEAREEVLQRVSCLRYPIKFSEHPDLQLEALLDSGSKVNAMHPDLAQKLGLQVRKINVGAQKIDRSCLGTFGMVIAGFSAEDKLGRIRFFEETFLLARIICDVVLGMPFLTLAEVQFADKGALTWSAYPAADALPTRRRVEVVSAKEFARLALGNDEAFVVHISALPIQNPEVEASTGKELGQVHPSRQAQISSITTSKEVEIPAEYLDYSDVFLTDSAAKLPEHTNANDHAIDLEPGKQPPYEPIYSLGPVELETLKTYIEANLANGFIRPSKSPAGAPIFFVKKKDGSLRLCVNYRGLNNITIKNRYPLLLIGESLDRLGRAKRFTQLDLTNAYHQMRIRKGDE